MFIRDWHLHCCIHYILCSWWRHQIETFSSLLVICAGNSPVPGEFPAQRPMTRNFDVFFDLRANKRLSKQWWGWWFETPSCALWRHSMCKLSVTGSCLFDIPLTEYWGPSKPYFPRNTRFGVTFRNENHVTNYWKKCVFILISALKKRMIRFWLNSTLFKCMQLYSNVVQLLTKLQLLIR